MIDQKSTRRGVLTSVAAGLAGFTMTETATAWAGQSRGQGAGSTLAHTTVEDETYVQDLAYYPGWTPTDREKRAYASVVGHSRPESIAGVEDEVRYTVAVSTTAATAWIDDHDEVVAMANDVRSVETVIDYPGETVRAHFPDDEDWIGGHRLNKDLERGPADVITDDSTVVGAVFDFGWGVVKKSIAPLSWGVKILDFVTDLASVDDDESTHTVTFEYPAVDPESVVNAYRMFEVKMNRADRAEISITTRLNFKFPDYTRNEFEHLIVLDPDPIDDADGGGGTGDRTETGRLQDGDAISFTHTPSDGIRDLTIELDGSGHVDFDLYATLDGREPSTSDYDRSSTDPGGHESITIDATAVAGDVGMLINSYSGSGEYTLEISESDGADARTGDSRFESDQRVETTTWTPVRSRPSASASRVDSVSAGSAGYVRDGPELAAGSVWWSVGFNAGFEGWVRQSTLTAAPLFEYNQRVETTTETALTERASVYASETGRVPTDTAGYVRGGPTRAAGHLFWKVAFNTGHAGWVRWDALRTAPLEGE